MHPFLFLLPLLLFFHLKRNCFGNLTSLLLLVQFGIGLVITKSSVKPRFIFGFLFKILLHTVLSVLCRLWKMSIISYLHVHPNIRSGLTLLIRTCRLLLSLSFPFVMLHLHFRSSPSTNYLQPPYWQSGRLNGVGFSTASRFFRSLLYIVLLIPWSVWMLNFSSICKYLAIHLIICFLFLSLCFSIS